MSYSKYGCRPAGGKRFNLHDLGEKTCFKPTNVMGENKIGQLVPTFSLILKLPHANNWQVRATAIQALRMASFTTKEVAKVSQLASTASPAPSTSTTTPGSGPTRGL